MLFARCCLSHSLTPLQTWKIHEWKLHFVLWTCFTRTFSRYYFFFLSFCFLLTQARGCWIIYLRWISLKTFSFASHNIDCMSIGFYTAACQTNRQSQQFFMNEKSFSLSTKKRKAKNFLFSFSASKIFVNENGILVIISCWARASWFFGAEVQSNKENRSIRQKIFPE